jgi:hypothetical protein
MFIVESNLDGEGVIKMYNAEFVIVDEEYDGFLVTANTEDFAIHCLGSSHLTLSSYTLSRLTRLYNLAVDLLVQVEGGTK